MTASSFGIPLGSYVDDYIALYYKTDKDVTGDYELQNWAKEIASWDGGHIKRFNADISVALLSLSKIIQRLLWTAGPQHAAVNFPQIDYFAFIPNLPAATYAPPPNNFKTASVDTAEVLALLPPAEQTGLQVQTTYSLAGYHYDQLLGYYDKLDPGARIVCKKYYNALHGGIKAEIDKRNKEEREATQGLLRYRFLPGNIPNSTSV